MKKIIGLISLILVFSCLTGCFYNKNNSSTNNEVISECNEPKCDPIPNYMISKPKNNNDYDIAKKFLEEIEQKYNTNFNIIGYNYFVDYELVDDKYMRNYILTGIHVYSDAYPQVYIKYCFNDEHCSNTEESEDMYLNEIKWWKQKNLIYDVAEEVGIDTNLLAINVMPNYDENKIYAELLIHNNVEIESIKVLSQKVREKIGIENITFKIYSVEKGNNDEYKKYMAGLGVNSEIHLDVHFGSWKRYKCVTDSSGTNLSLEWEHEQ